MLFLPLLRVNPVVQLPAILFVSLMLLVPLAMGDQKSDFDTLLVEVKVRLTAFESAHNKTVNHDGKYPHDWGSPEKNLEELQRTFEAGSEDERLELIESVTQGLSKVEQQEKALLSMTSNEIQQERKKLQDTIDEDIEAERKKKIEAAKAEIRRAEARAKREEEERIERSSPTYYRDKFLEREKRFFAIFNKRINFDGKMDDLYVGYSREALEEELARASSQQEKSNIYMRYHHDLSTNITKLEEMSQYEIDQRRDREFKWQKKAPLMKESASLVPSLNQLSKRLDALKEEIEDIPQEQCTSTKVDYDCGSRCEVMRRDPIFGTYTSDTDIKCMRNCQNSEERKQAEFDEEEGDCFREQRRNEKEFSELKRQYDSVYKDYKRKYDRYEAIEREMKEIEK